MRTVRSDDGLRALAGSVAVRDGVTEVCHATLALLVLCLALRSLGRGGHLARLGLGLFGAASREIPKTNIMEGTRKRPITGPSHPHSPECVEGKGSRNFAPRPAAIGSDDADGPHRCPPTPRRAFSAPGWATGGSRVLGEQLRPQGIPWTLR